jgi:hypothetical protein
MLISLGEGVVASEVLPCNGRPKRFSWISKLQQLPVPVFGIHWTKEDLV